MIKKISLLAVSALPATSHAADVKVYGKALAAVVNSTTKVGEQSHSYLVTKNSRFGVKAVEKISDGLEAIAVYEIAVDMRRKDAGMSKRDHYMGLNTSFGSVLMGYMDTPYKKAKSEPFADTIADQNAILSKGIELRAEDAVYFKSKEYAGLSLFAAYSDSQQTHTSFNNPNITKNLASVSLTYNMKPIKAAVAWQKIAQVAADDITATKLVISGGMSGVKFGLTYENIATESGDTRRDRTNTGLNLSYRAGEWEGIGEFIMAGESAVDNAKDDASLMTLAAKRHLSDKVSYYVMYSVLSNGENATFKPNGFSDELSTSAAEEEYTSMAVGMIFGF